MHRSQVFSFCSVLLFATAALQPVILHAEGDSSQCAAAPNYTYAQRLVDDTIAHHPELTAMVLHLTPPGITDNVIIASNIWLTGEKSDTDDIHVITSGITMTETNKAATKFEVEGVLQNVFGSTVGSMATVFPYKKGDNTALLEKKAQAIREELRRKILDPANLMDPFPFAARTPPRTYAQF